MLAPLHSASTDDAEGEAQAEALQADPLLRELVDLAATTSKSAFVSKLVCSECLGDLAVLVADRAERAQHREIAVRSRIGDTRC